MDAADRARTAAGIDRFNDLERGLPGISRSVLLQRLRALEYAGVVGREVGANGRASRYVLTPAGHRLQDVIDALGGWGARYAFREPQPNDLDAGLLMWWMRRRIARDRLPSGRTVVRFDFTIGRRRQRFWLLLERVDVHVCVEDPGFEVDLVVSAKLADFYQVWIGRIGYADALREGTIRVVGLPALERAFPTWLEWSPTADSVRAAATNA